MALVRLAYALAIDHGTSGIKTSIVSERGDVVATESEALPTVYLPDGGAEQDPELWWQAVLRTGRRVIEACDVAVEQIRTVAVSSTFSSTVAVDRAGRHVLPCLTWLDGRGAPYVREVMSGFPSFKGYNAAKALRWIRTTGGAPTLAGKDDIAHALYVRHARPDAYRETRTFLPSKDYLNLRLTGVVAASHDSMTLFWLSDARDVRRIRYDAELARIAGVDLGRLPPMRASTALLGPLLDDVAEALGLGRDVQVVLGSPDHQTAAVGAGAVADFEGHLYVGTSSWVQCTVPFKRTDVLHSIASLPTCIPSRWYCANEQDLAGGCLSFLLDNLVLREGPVGDASAPDGDYAALDRLAADVAPGSDGLLFCPWLNGERTPVDDDALRGAFVGISKTTTLAHFARAVMEGVAYNTRWSLRPIERFLGRRFPSLRFVGGGALSSTWCQIYADVLKRPICRVKNPREANARGAAFLAFIGLGVLRFDDLRDRAPVDRVFHPDASRQRMYDELFADFVDLHKALRPIFHRTHARRQR